MRTRLRMITPPAKEIPGANEGNVPMSPRTETRAKPRTTALTGTAPIARGAADDREAVTGGSGSDTGDAGGDTGGLWSVTGGPWSATGGLWNVTSGPAGVTGDPWGPSAGSEGVTGG